MRKTQLLMMLAMLLIVPALRAQVVTTDPSPLQEDSENVVVWFHADQGNKGLAGLTGATPIYAHTGVSVVDATGKETDWKYDTDWNTNLPKYELQYVSENLWKLEIGDIDTFYGVQPGETVTKLCFVFRNANGSKKGLEAGGADIFVPVVDAGFQMGFRKSDALDVFNTPTEVTFTATTTEEADIKIYVNDEKIGEADSAKSLAALYTFTTIGDYDVKAVATRNGISITKEIHVVYVRQSSAATDTTVPPLGLTKNADGSYTFCLAAPLKEGVMLVGSWDNYAPSNMHVMDYVDVPLDGGSFRYFKLTLPASVTGNEFGYYYIVDGTISVGDPYAHLVLDPTNDKYISPTVYPDMPQYPTEYVSGNVPIAWHSDDMLAYNWSATSFKAPAKEDLVIYELLFRDFTGTEGKAKGDGTVRQALDKLPYLKELGVNAIELLPINEFNGNNSWGYNPNFYFAIDKAYGTPQDYKEFIDKCHEEGIAVILDVVFNQSDWLHPWYRMYQVGSNPFYNATAPHAYSVLNDWNQGYPLVRQQWRDMLKFWLSEYKVDGFRFDLVKGLGDNDSYANAGDSGTNAYNASRIANMKMLHDAMREVNPDAYFINENLAGYDEEQEMAKDGEMNWVNFNNNGCQFAMGYNSGASLAGMWSENQGRTYGSTVGYLESHDEQRLAYKQDQWGVAAVKGNHEVSMKRCGGAAAQMILCPGAHMIWMFSEMGNAQNTKDNNGGNNTSAKIVNWNLLNDPDNYGLMKNYSELINIRLSNPELFAPTAEYKNSFSGWSGGRKATSVAGDKELYLVVNPSTTNVLEMSIPFVKNDNDAYHVVSKSYGSTPLFDAAEKKVAVEPNCYAVISTRNLAGIESVSADDNASSVAIMGVGGEIRVAGVNGIVEVYALDGKTLASTRTDASGRASIAMPAGMYVVKAGNKVAKIRL